MVWVERQRTAGHERSGGGPNAERVVHLGQLSASLREFPLASCAQRMGLRYRHIGTCLALALGAALADGVMLALLVPLGKGVGTGSFASFWSVPLVRRLISEPQSFAAGFLVLASLMFALALVKNLLIHLQHLTVGHLRTRFAHRLAGVYCEQVPW